MADGAAHLDPEYRKALVTCAALNFAMLLLEGGGGLAIGSAALVADAVDFLEDGVVLALGVLALGWTARRRADAGMVQALAMASVGLAAVFEIVRRLMAGGAPRPLPLGAVAGLALAVNFYCAYRLVRFRSGDASMRGLWLSSRNDAMLNVLTMGAAGLIAVTHSGWPDVAAGAIIAGVNLFGAVEVFRAGLRERRASGGAVVE